MQTIPIARIKCSTPKEGAFAPIEQLMLVQKKNASTINTTENN